MRVSVRVWTLAALMLCVGWGGTAAQGSATGSVAGVITDPSGGVLPGATVRAVNPATGVSQSTVAGSSGDWTIPSLPVGRYEISFELDGFKKLTRGDVLVEAAVTRQINVTLDVGSVSEQVTVYADAPLIVANTAATYRRLAAEELTQVPTSTRSFTHLLSAEAGVSAELPPVLVNGTGNVSPSVNGTRTTSTSLFFNGIDATNITSNEGSMSDNISPAPEMLEEVKLQTSLYDASTGRSGGGNFQLITRSGTNAYRGGLQASFQHERFNENDFFYERDGIAKPRARRLEAGITFGGPAPRRGSVASVARSASRTPRWPDSSTSTSRTPPAPSSRSKRGRQSSASTSRRPSSSQTPGGRSTTRCR